VY
ncbi:unnamed protein product, partial [Arabidopsis lyrata]|jgi:hypothetical protein